MPKSFEYKDSKELLKFYKKFLQNLKNSSNTVDIYKNDIVDTTRNLDDRKYFSSIVEDGINNKNIDLHKENTYKFISNIFYYKESCKCNEICKYVITGYESNIENLIKSLSNGKNPIRWLFSSKNKKDEAEDAYNELLRLKEESSIKTSLSAIDSLNKLKKTNPDTIIEDFQNSVDEYRDIIKNVMPKHYNAKGNIKIFNDYVNKYNNIKKINDNLDVSIKTSATEIKDTVNRLLAENLVNELRAIPVDELARDKSGIKVKYLKDGGYQNLADVLAASQMQIASIYGVSQDKAYTIKTKCDNYAKKINSQLKIKLSTDDKNTAATNVVKAICTYLRKIEFKNEVQELEKTYNSSLNKTFNTFDSIGSGIKWLFMTNEEINDVKDQFELVKNILNNIYKPKIDVINFN